MDRPDGELLARLSIEQLLWATRSGYSRGMCMTAKWIKHVPFVTYLNPK